MQSDFRPKVHNYHSALLQGRSQPHSPGWARVPLSSFFLKFRSIFLIFPQTLIIFFVILALRVGDSPTREGPGYATALLAVHAKPTNTIRSMLGSPKEKSGTLNKTGTVYHYACQECPSQYIGETERPFQEVVSEHTQEHKRNFSPVDAHSKETKHSFDLKHGQTTDMTDPITGFDTIEAIFVSGQQQKTFSL